MSAISETIRLFLELLMTLIFIRVILSWIIRDPRNPIMQLMMTLTEPILAPIRSLLFKFNIGGNMIDFSAIFAFLLIRLLLGML